MSNERQPERERESRCKGELIIFPTLISLQLEREQFDWFTDRFQNQCDRTQPLSDTRIEYFAPPMTNYQQSWTFRAATSASVTCTCVVRTQDAILIMSRWRLPVHICVSHLPLWLLDLANGLCLCSRSTVKCFPGAFSKIHIYFNLTAHYIMPCSIYFNTYQLHSFHCRLKDCCFTLAWLLNIYANKNSINIDSHRKSTLLRRVVTLLRILST